MHILHMSLRKVSCSIHLSNDLITRDPRVRNNDMCIAGDANATRLGEHSELDVGQSAMCRSFELDFATINMYVDTIVIV